MKLYILAICLFCTGCASVLRPQAPPFERTFRLVVSEPSLYSIKVQGVTTNVYPVMSNGNVHIKVPENSRECDKLLFGIIKIEESGWPHVYVLKKNHKITELSSMALWAQEPNKEGVYEIHIRP
jgi:hypothetical protein